MKSDRKTAAIVGALFLASYCGVFVGSAIYGPILNAPEHLVSIYPNRTQVTLGVLLELINDAAVIGIAVMLFPILRRHSESMAVAYVGFRVVEAVTLVVGKLSTLTLVTLSQEYVASGAPSVSYYQTLDALSLAARSWAGKMTVVFFILGALILYCVLYGSKLLPRFIAVWGFVAVASLIAANLLGIPDLTQGFHPAMILYFPIVLNELFLAIWLIAKGFSPSAVASQSTRQI